MTEYTYNQQVTIDNTEKKAEPKPIQEWCEDCNEETKHTRINWSVPSEKGSYLVCRTCGTEVH